MDLQLFAQALNEFDNVLITDDKGCAIFYDLADLNILMEVGLTPDEFFYSTIYHLKQVPFLKYYKRDNQFYITNNNYQP
ncbi:hypothetical protein ACIQ6U_22840 [Lysinibacillus fusiformis]|uniref:hypothetical protein n=1 Tax=Lysinibacillus fusiformis TaxID=28031 RepID=UPI0037FA7B54